jgi:hypothetical protein
MDVPESQRIYRYWVELRDRRDGAVRVMTQGAINSLDCTGCHGAAMADWPGCGDRFAVRSLPIRQESP